MRGSTEVAAIDANVIVRYVAADHPAHHASARALFQAVKAGTARVLCDPVNLAEVVFVLQKFYGVPRKRIGEELGALLQAPDFLVPDKARYLWALDMYAAGELSFGDACACAAALEDCEGRLYSFDRKLSGVPGVERIERAP